MRPPRRPSRRGIFVCRCELSPSPHWMALLQSRTITSRRGCAHLTVRPPIFDSNVLTVNITSFAQSFEERARLTRVTFGRSEVEKSDPSPFAVLVPQAAVPPPHRRAI